MVRVATDSALHAMPPRVICLVLLNAWLKSFCLSGCWSHWPTVIAVRVLGNRELVQSLISNGDTVSLEIMRANDQLRKAKAHGKTFLGLREGPVLFRPTYKLEVGSDRYSSSNKKVRVPAWTDRILYRCNKISRHGHHRIGTDFDSPGGPNNGPDGFGDHPAEFDSEMALLTYKSLEELKQSDHRPVVAVFAGPKLAGRQDKVCWVCASNGWCL